MIRLTERGSRPVFASLMAGTMLVSWPALAQTETAQGNDIVVTALKRETTLQDTPISISALGEQALANNGIKDVSDLGASVPGLNFVDGGPGSRRVAIRGIQSAGEPTVGVYYDEIPVTGSPGNTADAGGSTPELRLFDVSRVEVLRGPQGTLYGSSSMGGTLRVIFNKPTYDFEGKVDSNVSLTDGGEPNMDISAMVNIPLVDQKLAMRAVGFYNRFGGYVDNVHLGIDDVNSSRTYGGRLMLRANPTENLTVDLAAIASRMSGSTGRWHTEMGAYNLNAYALEPVTDDNDIFSATVNWELDSVAITAVVSHANKRLTAAGDVSAYLQGQRTPARCTALVGRGNPCTDEQLSDFYEYVDFQGHSVTYSPRDNMKNTSAELRASSTGDNWLNWTVGGFYANRDADIERAQFNTDPINGRILVPYQYVTTRLIEDSLEQKAAFGEITVEPFAGLSLTGGLRVFDYKKSVSNHTLISNYLVGAVAGDPTYHDSSESGTVLKFNASYDINSDIMVYATASQGFRPGGVNTSIGLEEQFQSYGSDKLWNYEVGTKTNLFGGLVQLNLDAFQIDWTNIQVSGRTPNGAFSFITNAGGARIRGVEADAFIRPMDGLAFTLTGSYTDAKLTVDQANSSLQAAGLKNDRIPYIPQIQVSGSIDYTWSLSENFDANIHINARHVGESFSDFRPTGTYTRKIDAYQLVNMRIGLTEHNDNWGIALFVNNLMNDVIITRASASALTTGLTSVNSVPPRTIGLNFHKSF